MCRRWDDTTDNNDEYNPEYERFLQTEDYKKMVRNVFQRLGYRFVLNESIINDMYDMCRYEKAW